MTHSTFGTSNVFGYCRCWKRASEVYRRSVRPSLYHCKISTARWGYLRMGGLGLHVWIFTCIFQEIGFACQTRGSFNVSGRPWGTKGSRGLVPRTRVVPNCLSVGDT
jgi:hypothetical protein